MDIEQEIQQALEKTYAAMDQARRSGDQRRFKNLEASAKALTTDLVSIRKFKNPVENYFAGMVNAAGQGISAGGSDEISALGSSVVDGDTYAMDRDIRREGLRQYGEDYPKTNFAADMFGTIIGPAKFFAPFPKGASTWQKAGQLMKEGTVLGLAEGVGRSTGSDPVEIATDAGTTALIGGFGAPLGAAVGAGLGGVTRWVQSNFKKASKDDATKAAELILDQIEEGGMKISDVEEALKKLGPEATLMDVTNTLRGLGIASTTKSSAALETIMEPVLERQAGAGDRVRSALFDAAGNTATSPASPGRVWSDPANIRKGLQASREATANRLYPLAESQSVPREAIEDILDNDLVAPMLRRLRHVDASGIPKDIDWGADSIPVKYIDDLKQALDKFADVSKVNSPAERTQAGYYKSILDQLKSRTDELVPEYGAARQAYEKGSRMIKADDLTENLPRVKGRALDEVEDRVQGMGQDEGFIFRNSAAGRLGDYSTREGTAGGPMANKVQRIAGDTGSDRDRLLNLVSRDGDSRMRLEDKINAEQEFFDTYKLVNPNANSKTAQYQAAAGRADMAQSMIEDGISELAITGDPTGVAIRGIVRMLGDNNVSPNQASEIAKMLMDPQTTLAKLKKIVNKTDASGPVKTGIINGWKRLRQSVDVTPEAVRGGAALGPLGMSVE